MKPARWLPGTLLALTLLAGCGANSSSDASPSATATNIPAPTATPTVDPAFVAQACGSDFAKAGKFSQVGDLIFTQPRLGGLSYPGIKLPDDLSQGKPYQVATFSITTRIGPDTIYANPIFHTSPDTSATGGNYQFAVCNASATTDHTLQAVGVKIATLTLVDPAKTNFEPGCDSPFSSTHRVGATFDGCGGSTPASAELFEATWPATVTAGTTATIVKQTDNELSNPGGPDTSGLFGNFPVTLRHGKTITLVVGMDYPNQPGVYTFVFGLQADSAPMAFTDSTVASQQVLLAKNAQDWSGEGCNDAAYQAQIPNDGTEKFYLCEQTL